MAVSDKSVYQELAGSHGRRNKSDELRRRLQFIWDRSRSLKKLVMEVLPLVFVWDV